MSSGPAVTGSPKSGRDRSAMPRPAGSPRCTGPPCTAGSGPLSRIAVSRRSGGTGRIDTTMGPRSRPAGRHESRAQPPNAPTRARRPRGPKARGQSNAPPSGPCSPWGGFPSRSGPVGEGTFAHGHLAVRDGERLRTEPCRAGAGDAGVERSAPAEQDGGSFATIHVHRELRRPRRQGPYRRADAQRLRRTPAGVPGVDNPREPYEPYLARNLLILQNPQRGERDETERMPAAYLDDSLRGWAEVYGRRVADAPR